MEWQNYYDDLVKTRKLFFKMQEDLLPISADKSLLEMIFIHRAELLLNKMAKINEKCGNPRKICDLTSLSSQSTDIGSIEVDSVCDAVNNTIYFNIKYGKGEVVDEGTMGFTIQQLQDPQASFFKPGTNKKGGNKK